jgi:hypothetical protein
MSTAFELQTLERRKNLDREILAAEQKLNELRRQRTQLQLECQHLTIEEHNGACTFCGIDPLMRLFQECGA